MTAKLPDAWYTDYRCPRCNLASLPYKKGFKCPSCGLREQRESNLIGDLINIMEINQTLHGFYTPPGMLITSIQEQMLSLLLSMADFYGANRQRYASFEDCVYECVDNIETDKGTIYLKANLEGIMFALNKAKPL